jgi:peroxiredoxin
MASAVRATWRRLSGWAAAWVTVATLCAASAVARPHVVHPLVGRLAPEIVRPLLSGPGGNFRLSERRGEVVLVGFWTSWCSRCAEHLKTLQELDATYASAGLVVVGVSLDDTAEKARNLIRRSGVNVRALVDAGRELGSVYDVDSVPFLVLIDRDGIVRYVHGAQNVADAPTLKRELRLLLDE